MTTFLKVEPTFVSVGVNRDVNAVTYLDTSTEYKYELCVYAAYKLVTVYDVNQGKVVSTLRGHTGRVNAVAYIEHANSNSTIAVISGSVDNQLIVWHYDKVTQQYRIEQTINAAASVVAISTSVLYIDQRSINIIAYSCSNGGIDIYVQHDKQTTYVLHQHIHNKYTSLTLSLACITQNNITPLIVLCTAGINDRIDIHVSLIDTDELPYINDFISVATLEGHTDWIHNIDYCVLDQVADNSNTCTLLLSSASQDKTVRLWRLQHTIISNVGANDAEFAISSFNSRTHTIKYHSTQCSAELHISSESVLHGHENWVMSSRWAPSIYNNHNNTYTQPMMLLSSSTDKTMIVWSYDTQHSLWNISARVGELGGHTLGFYGAHWGSQAQCIIGNGYSGCFQRWCKVTDNNNNIHWQSSVVVSGHTSAVCDISWDSNQQYITTTSTDQTTRVFAQWNNTQYNGNNNWYEIARPQIHGYNLNCLTPVYQQEHMYVSGADEKILRVFYAPIPYIHTLNNINQHKSTSNNTSIHIERAVQAQTPELGLSNKASSDVLPNGDTIDHTSIPTTPPNENFLISQSLWPEIEKLYGHGYEVVSVTCNNLGTLLASASLAKQAVHAGIRLWRTSDWSECSILLSHQLTVVQLQFSHNDKYLLSVSRDRYLSLFYIPPTITDTPTTSQCVLLSKIKAHTRIVWCCSWSYDDQIFATGARDKYVKVWRINSAAVEKLQNHKTVDKQFIMEDTVLPVFSHAVTSIAFAPQISAINQYLLAIGMEDGGIEVWTSTTLHNQSTWSRAVAIDLHICPADVVRKMVWRYNTVDGLQLAVCSDDHTVRLYTIQIPNTVQ